MDATEIVINGKHFKLQFGMKCLRLLGLWWKAPGLNEVFAKLTVFESMTDNVTFEQLDVINDLILAAIQTNKSNKKTLTADELDELFLADTAAMTSIIEKVMQGFIASIPQAQAVGK